MRLSLVEHGQAFPAAEHPDRPLTDQGRREVETVAVRLARRQPPVSRIIHSGKTRARRTAAILADHLKPSPPVEAAAGLDPHAPVEPWIAAANGWTEDRLLVGHQPFLGKLVSRLLLGEERALVDYRPGTVVCLEPTSAGDWRIVGMLGPALPVAAVAGGDRAEATEASDAMIGAIAGDIIGSVYEQHPIKTTDFPLFQPRSRFTDDSVLTVAIADAILTGQPYLDAVRDWGRRYPRAGYGGTFFQWLFAADPRPYHSWGNGSAMRVSPVGWAFAAEDEVLRQARLTAEITHDHPEGIKGAQATALAVYLARTGAAKTTIRARIQRQFGYDLAGTVDTLRPGYTFDVSCQGTVPAALIAFLDADSYEQTVRNAVSLGGDSDTLACIAGGIAEACYGGVPEAIRAEVRARLAPDLWRVVEAFEHRYPVGAVRC